MDRKTREQMCAYARQLERSIEEENETLEKIWDVYEQDATRMKPPRSYWQQKRVVDDLKDQLALFDKRLREAGVLRKKRERAESEEEAVEKRLHTMGMGDFVVIPAANPTERTALDLEK